MANRGTTITRKGQITMPIEIRRALNLAEGERLSVEQAGETVLLRRAPSVAERTAGMLAQYGKTPPPTLEAESDAFEQAVADEVTALLET